MRHAQRAPADREDIRSEDENPGLRPFEASLLRLLDRVTSGSHLEINETGTKLKYQPGLVLGGRVAHDCGTGRAVGWFLEVLAALALFGKLPLHATLDGVTNDHVDSSVDSFKATTLPLLRHFGLEEGLDLVVKKRGAPRSAEDRLSSGVRWCASCGPST